MPASSLNYACILRWIFSVKQIFSLKHYPQSRQYKNKECNTDFLFLFFSLLITRYFLSCRAFQTKIISWFGRSLVKWLLIFKGRILGIPVWLFHRKSANHCWPTVVKTVAKVSAMKKTNKENNKAKTKTENKKTKTGTISFFTFISLCFLSIFFSFFFCVVWFRGFFRAHETCILANAAFS